MDESKSGPPLEERRNTAKLREYLSTPNCQVAWHSHPEEPIRQVTPENRYYGEDEREWKRKARNDNKGKCCSLL
ncbi:hypothetical protein QR680_004724 [Steinernema hermaphroditum]|uniref:Uncharacterized protein n=1 Tax=Steinernema hermaphroditum TaxID=289476 RepID=A0AA39HPL6_9BILA|nr:hypothetical protein QR680_004724 [Steinernema hermaphroditum]